MGDPLLVFLNGSHLAFLGRTNHHVGDNAEPVASQAPVHWTPVVPLCESFYTKNASSPPCTYIASGLDGGGCGGSTVPG